MLNPKYSFSHITLINHFIQSLSASLGILELEIKLAARGAIALVSSGYA
jgi:hypothetical protein